MVDIDKTIMWLSNILYGLQKMSIVRCADTTGIVKGCIIGLGKNRHGTGKIGDVIKISVREKTPTCTFTNKTPRGIIVRTRKRLVRRDGMAFSFSDNAMVIIANNKLVANKINGPVLLETRHSCRNFSKQIL